MLRSPRCRCRILAQLRHDGTVGTHVGRPTERNARRVRLAPKPHRVRGERRRSRRDPPDVRGRMTAASRACDKEAPSGWRRADCAPPTPRRRRSRPRHRPGSASPTHQTSQPRRHHQTRTTRRTPRGARRAAAGGPSVGRRTRQPSPAASDGARRHRADRGQQSESCVEPIRQTPR